MPRKRKLSEIPREFRPQVAWTIQKRYWREGWIILACIQLCVGINVLLFAIGKRPFSPLWILIVVIPSAIWLHTLRTRIIGDEVERFFGDRCKTCGYSTIGLTGGRCPECGGTRQ